MVRVGMTGGVGDGCCDARCDMKVACKFMRSSFDMLSMREIGSNMSGVMRMTGGGGRGNGREALAWV